MTLPAASVLQVFHAPDLLSCTDTSVAWDFGAVAASSVRALQGSTDALDHLAF